MAKGDVLLVSENGVPDSRKGKPWYPEDMALKPDDYMTAVAPEQDKFGVLSALDLWLRLEENGYMDTGLSMYSRETIRASFEQALRKYKS